jgi:hypothetical protein
MSITLSGTTPLANASIQYTYPEMDIRGIDKSNIIKFKFRNGLSSSSFSFTDIDTSTFISGITMEGTISTGKHKFIEGDSKTTYPLELTIKHIKSSDGSPFYVVFPIASGGKTSFINSISDSENADINVINISADNKSLNSMIGDEYSSTFYKYINNDNVLVFVFKTPITMSMKNDKIPKVKSAHSLWSDAKTPIFLASNDVVGGKVSEEIVCDYSGDTVQTINNEPLNRGAAKIGWTTLVFILLAVWIGYFYSIDFINKNLLEFKFYGLTPIIINIIIVAAVFVGVYVSNKKLSMYTSPEAILIFISLLWPIDFVFRSVVYLILMGINSISSFDSDLNNSDNYIDFIVGYLNGEISNQNSKRNKFAKYALSALFMVWIIAIFAIVSK